MEGGGLVTTINPPTPLGVSRRVKCSLLCLFDWNLCATYRAPKDPPRSPKCPPRVPRGLPRSNEASKVVPENLSRWSHSVILKQLLSCDLKEMEQLLSGNGIARALPRELGSAFIYIYIYIYIYECGQPKPTQHSHVRTFTHDTRIHVHTHHDCMDRMKCERLAVGWGQLSQKHCQRCTRRRSADANSATQSHFLWNMATNNPTSPCEGADASIKLDNTARALTAKTTLVRYEALHFQRALRL